MVYGFVEKSRNSVDGGGQEWVSGSHTCCGTRWVALTHTVSFMDAMVKIAILVLFPSDNRCKPVLCNHATLVRTRAGMTFYRDYEDSCISLPNPTAPVQILAY